MTVTFVALVAAGCGSADSNAGEATTVPPAKATTTDEATTIPPTKATTTTQAPTEQASSELELGTSVDFEDWNIGIMKVTRDDGIAPYDPEPGTEYAGFRVELTGTYAGEGDSSIDIDFTIKYVGTDKRVYASFNSNYGDAEPLVSGPNVAAGGTQTVEFSLAVPTSALGGNVITLESSFSPAESPSWNAGI